MGHHVGHFHKIKIYRSPFQRKGFQSTHTEHPLIQHSHKAITQDKPHKQLIQHHTASLSYPVLPCPTPQQGMWDMVVGHGGGTENKE